MRVFITLLALAGFFNSCVLTYIKLTSLDNPFCSPTSGCRELLTSKYSELFSLPISFYGTIFFTYILISTILLFKRKSYFKSLVLEIVLLIGSFLSIGLTLFITLSFKSWCYYCLSSHAITLLISFLWFFSLRTNKSQEKHRGFFSFNDLLKEIGTIMASMIFAALCTLSVESFAIGKKYNSLIGNPKASLVTKIAGKSISEAGLPKEVRLSLYEKDLEKYHLKKKWTEDYLFSLYIEHHEDAFLDGVASFAEQASNYPGPMYWPKYIRRHINQTNKPWIADYRSRFLPMLKARYKMDLLIRQPMKPIIKMSEAQSFVEVKDLPFIGKANAPLSFLIFSDYTCIHCKAKHKEIEKLMDRYPEQASLTIVPYTFTHQFKTMSELSAVASLLAKKENKYHLIKKKLFEKQRHLNTEMIISILQEHIALSESTQAQLKELGDKGIWQDNLKGYQEKLQAVRNLADHWGIASSPVVYLNGELLFKNILPSAQEIKSIVQKKNGAPLKEIASSQ